MLAKILKTALHAESLRLTDSKLPVSIFIVWLFIVSALIGIALGHADWFIEKTPLNLMIGAVLLFVNFPIDNAKKVALWFFAFLTGMTVEILGVKTGLLFGEYYYGENMGAKFMGVPYLIGIYWAVLSFICAAIGQKLTRKSGTREEFTLGTKILAAAVGAGFMVLLDVFMEQLASPFDFWHFAGGLAPLQNYLTWYVVAFALQLILLLNIKINDFLYSVNLYLSQVVFFGVCLLLL